MDDTRAGLYGIPAILNNQKPNFNLLPLLRNSNIGFGIDTEDETGPRYTNRQVLASIDSSRVVFSARRAADLEVLSTTSPLSSTYLSAGWSNAKLAAKTPCDEVGVPTPLSHHSEPQKDVYVTGRFSFVHLAVSLTDYVTKLQPHPQFKEDIMNALALDAELERTKEVKRVLSWYGTMFPTSVEMGGKKHLTIRRPIDDRITESSVKQDMATALSKSFKAVMHEAEINGDTERTGEEMQESGPDPLYFSTVGGLVEASSFSEWKGSLALPENWAVIKVLEVESVLSLFYTDTRLKIALAVFKAPLYQFMNKVNRDCLSIDPDPRNIPVTSDGPWFNYGSLGMVLTHPLDGAIPFHHVYDDQRHLFTTRVAEKHQHLNEWGFTDQGILCYVHLAQKPGTIPLHRMWNENLPNKTYVKTNEIEDRKKLGYLDEGIRYYVYST